MGLFFFPMTHQYLIRTHHIFFRSIIGMMEFVMLPLEKGNANTTSPDLCSTLGLSVRPRVAGAAAILNKPLWDASILHETISVWQLSPGFWQIQVPEVVQLQTGRFWTRNTLVITHPWFALQSLHVSMETVVHFIKSYSIAGGAHKGFHIIIPFLIPQWGT